MRVLVTGHRGYLGSVLTGVLSRARFDVVGVDCNLYADCDFGRVVEAFPSFDCDLREIVSADLASFDAVVHLAEVPESASSGLDPLDARRVNRDMTLHLAKGCREAGVRHFVFASSCEVYGRGGRAFTEEDAVDPQTPGAKTKAELERALLGMSDAAFNPIIHRFATMYGVSPRLRLDRAINDMVASAVVNGRVVVGSDARAWRPFVHVEDAARAIAAVLIGADSPVDGRTFNLIAPDDNYRLIDVADLVAEIVPDCVRSISAHAFDEPSYRVSGQRFEDAVPQFTFRWTLSKGIVQLRNALRNAGMTHGEWRSDRYRRQLHLLTMIERGELELCGDAKLLRPRRFDEAAMPVPVS